MANSADYIKALRAMPRQKQLKPLPSRRRIDDLERIRRFGMEGQFQKQKFSTPPGGRRTLERRIKPRKPRGFRTPNTMLKYEKG